MSVDIQKEPNRKSDQASSPSDQPRPSLLARFLVAMSEINWRLTLITAVVMAMGWCLLFLSFSFLQILAGIVPVTAGLWLGRRVKKQLLLHGLILGMTGFVLGASFVAIYGALSDTNLLAPIQVPNDTGGYYTISTSELLVFYLSFSTMAMIPFPAFGAVMSGRAEQRQRELREQIESRGGRLEKPHVVRTLEDLQGLSLPQLGTYVNNLFQKHSFSFDDYRFIDKDKHLELKMVYQDEIYLLRLSVADKVRPGTIEGLLQEMRRRGIAKGVVLTSTEFTPDALKSAKGHKNLVLIDGQTLFDIAER